MSIDVGSLKSLKRTELQALAKEHNLAASGKNDELIARLTAKAGESKKQDSSKQANTSGGKKGTKRKEPEPAATEEDVEDEAAEPKAKKAKSGKAAAAKSKAKAKGKGKGKGNAAKGEEEEEESGDTKDDKKAAATDGKKEKSHTDKGKGSKQASGGASSEQTACGVPYPLLDGPGLNDLSFCFTGEFKNPGRNQLEFLIKQAGGRVSSNITKSLDYLVCGADGIADFGKKTGTGSSKYKEAKKAKKPIVDEDWIKTLLERASKSRSAAMQVDTKIDPAAVAKDAAEAAKSEVVKYFLNCIKQRPEGVTPDVPGVTEFDIRKLEAEIAMEIPDDLRTFWKFRNGTQWEEGDHPFNIPKLEDVKERFGGMWSKLDMLPFYDEDMLWEGLDMKTGYWCRFDGECNTSDLFARSVTHALKLYDQVLKKAIADGEDLKMLGISSILDAMHPNESDRDRREPPPAIVNRFWSYLNKSWGSSPIW